jgi:hypothetical protein
MNEGGLWERSISLRGNSLRGNWRENSFTVDPKDMLIGPWKWEAVSTGTPFWGTWGDAPFPGPLKEEQHTFYQENFYEELERYVKEGS